MEPARCQRDFVDTLCGFRLDRCGYSNSIGSSHKGALSAVGFPRIVASAAAATAAGNRNIRRCCCCCCCCCCLRRPLTRCTTNAHEEDDDINFNDETHFPSLWPCLQSKVMQDHQSSLSAGAVSSATGAAGAGFPQSPRPHPTRAAGAASFLRLS